MHFVCWPATAHHRSYVFSFSEGCSQKRSKPVYHVKSLLFCLENLISSVSITLQRHSGCSQCHPCADPVNIRTLRLLHLTPNQSRQPMNRYLNTTDLRNGRRFCATLLMHSLDWRRGQENICDSIPVVTTIRPATSAIKMAASGMPSMTVPIFKRVAITYIGGGAAHEMASTIDDAMVRVPLMPWQDWSSRQVTISKGF